jgi:hypothetical protein
MEEIKHELNSYFFGKFSDFVLWDTTADLWNLGDYYLVL